MDRELAEEVRAALEALAGHLQALMPDTLAPVLAEQPGLTISLANAERVIWRMAREGWLDGTE